MKLPVKPSMKITTTRVTIVDSAQIFIAECQNEIIAEKISDSLNKYEALKARHDKLKEYSQHLPNCKMRWTLMQLMMEGIEGIPNCTCGFEQALKESEEQTND